MTQPDPKSTVDQVRVDDEIVGPWGRFHFRVTCTNGGCIDGVYTKVPPSSYQIGSPCRYLKSDWKNGVEYVQHDAT